MEGFVLGVSMGWFCLLSCGMYLAPFLFAEESSTRQNSAYVALFLAGRLLAYMGIGALAGLAGGTLSAHYHGQFRIFSAFSGIAIGLLLLLGGLFRSFPTLKPCRHLGKIYKPATVSLLFGLLGGLSICPPIVSAVASVFTKGSALAGALYFLWFYLGTCLLFVPLFLVKVKGLTVDAVKSVARIVMLLMAGYFLIRGLLCLVS
jgi:sulfite exporter TauE/SafE